MSILAEIVIVISIISANISGLIFAKKTSSKLISILISTLLLILLCTISFDDFIIITDVTFALVAFFITILLLFFIPTSFKEITAHQKLSIFGFVVILSAFFLFIFSLVNINDFHQVFLEKTKQDSVFVSSHFDDEPIKEFYLNKKNNAEQLIKKENIREFGFVNNKILKEKLTNNPLLYRFSEIVLLSSLFVIMLSMFTNKRV